MNQHTRRHTPYTTSTGIRIGDAYHPMNRPAMDRDAYRLQRALLKLPSSDLDVGGILIATVCTCLICAGLLTFWSK